MDSSGTEGRLRAHVAALAGTIGERHLLRPHALAAAADYIDAAWRAQGYVPERETFTVNGVELRQPGDHPAGPARRDPAGRRALRHRARQPGCGRQRQRCGRRCSSCRVPSPRVEPERTVRFVAFTNEEPPFCFTEQQGSVVHARAARARGERIVLMVSLEMLGYYDDRPGQPALPTAVPLVLPGPRRLPGLRRRSALARHRCSERRPLFAPRANSRSRPAPPSAGSRVSAGATTRRSGGRATEPSWSPTRPFIAIPTTTPPTTCPRTLDYGRFAAAVNGLSATVMVLATSDCRA